MKTLFSYNGICTSNVNIILLHMHVVYAQAEYKQIKYKRAE